MLPGWKFRTSIHYAFNQEVERLCKRFHQQVEGKGLDLFMVKTQVEMPGGTIDSTSEVNRGTEFLIRFQCIR